MYYYNRLNYGLKQFFDKLNFEPQDKFEVDTFLRSYFDIDANKTIIVDLKHPVVKNGEQYKQVISNKNNFLDLFLFDIWKQLDMGQRLQAIFFAYKNMIETETELISNQPQMLFNCENCGFRGVYYTLKNKSYIEISVQHLLNNDKNPLNLLATMRHELYHCQQDIYRNNLIKKIITNNKNGIKNTFLDNYSINMLLDNYDYTAYCNDVAKRKDLILLYEKNKDFNEDTYNLVKYWNSIKFTESWERILELLYFMQDLESAAYNKGAKYVENVNKYFLENFENYQTYTIDNTDKILKSKIKKLNNSFNFNLTYEDLTEFEKINTLLVAGNLKNNGKVEQIFVDNPDFFKTINWEVMKYLLEIHKNKKLTNKISLKDLKQNENKIKNTLDQLQQM